MGGNSLEKKKGRLEHYSQGDTFASLEDKLGKQEAGAFPREYGKEKGEAGFFLETPPYSQKQIPWEREMSRKRRKEK